MLGEIRCGEVRSRTMFFAIDGRGGLIQRERPGTLDCVVGAR